MLSGMKKLGRTSSGERKVTVIIAAMLIVLAFGQIASAQVIDFETLYPGYETNYIQIPNGYEGFNWSYYFRGMTSKDSLGSGYEKGTIGKMSAYTSGMQNVSMSSVSSASFDFIGADITAAWLNNELVTVEGWRAGQRVYSQNITTSTSGPYWFDFNFHNVDTIWFKPATDLNNRHIVIDNITVTPEPATLVLLGLGGMLVRKHRK
jgi:hypothetical protein